MTRLCDTILLWRQMHRRLRFDLFRRLRNFLLFPCCSLIFIHYLSIKLLFSGEIPSPTLTRLHPNLPITLNLQTYAVCHPNQLSLDNLTAYYQQYSKPETCFLIEHLDGPSWWSDVTLESAEILTSLKNLGIKSNILYRSLSHPSDFSTKTNLTKYFFNACQFDEKLAVDNQIPIIILLWDIDRLHWYEMNEEWNHLFKTLPVRLLVFIDDLHYTTNERFFSRQYFFQFIASEIFSTYAYLFHNYYDDIPSSKITWLPHAASSLSSRSINHSAENRLFVSGANMLEWYPCRSHGFLLCQSRQDLVACLKQSDDGKTMKSGRSGQQYVFGLGTCESVHYAIAKLFELPANGLVLVTTKDLIPVLERLNLYHNEHFLTIECASINQLTTEVMRLQNLSTEMIENIRMRSQEAIYERHLTRHRAELLHVRLLAQALLAIASTENERKTWEQWGRDCA